MNAPNPKGLTARDAIVILSGAKDLWPFFPAGHAKNPEMFRFAQHDNAERRIFSCAFFILRASARRLIVETVQM